MWREMMALRLPSWLSVLLLLASILSICNSASAASSSDTQYVEYTNDDGQTLYLANDRRPALYTQNFGDCQGDSIINVTRFDAAYYKDNMTVLFHLEGNSALTNESLMRTLFLPSHREQKLILPSSLHWCFRLRRAAFRIDLQSMQRQHQQSLPS